MASASDVSLGVINGFFSVSGSILNILVTVVILKHTELQKGLNFLIVSLTAADLVNCLVAQPMYVYYLSRGREASTRFLEAFEIIAYIGLHAVVSNLITITYHRMMALSRPFSHLLQVSRKDLLIGILLTWVVSIIVGVIFAPYLPGKVAGAYFHAVMIAVLVLTYVRILLMSRNKRRQIAEQVEKLPYRHQAATMDQENTAAVTSAILVGTTLLSFVPDVTLDLISWEKAATNRLQWNYTLLFTCAALNPCIIIWRSHQLRRVLLQTIRFAHWTVTSLLRSI